MAIRSVKVSDLDGSEPADTTVVIREHPAIQQAKSLDVTAAQAKALVDRLTVKNVVTVELRLEDGTPPVDVLVSTADLDKWLGAEPRSVKYGRDYRHYYSRHTHKHG